MRTYTFAILEISKEAFDEIYDKLNKIEHSFHTVNGQTVIDMHGIALQQEGMPTLPKEEILYERKPKVAQFCKVKKIQSTTPKGAFVITMPNGESIPEQVFTRVTSVAGEMPYAIVKLFVDLEPK